MVVLPFEAVANTVAKPELLIVATLVAEEVHVGELTVIVAPFASVPFAANCCV